MSTLVLAHRDHNGVTRILNLPDAVDPGEPATMRQVLSIIEALQWKDNVRVRTTNNVNLAAPGANLDGIAMAVGDRFATMGQTNQAQQGIFIWNGAATPATRALDANTVNELKNAIFSIDEGSSAGTTWRQTQVNFVLDTDPVLFQSFGTVAPAASDTTPGIIEIATQAEVDAGVDTIRAVTPAALAAYAGRKMKFAANIGDGSATSFVVTHNFNTRDCQIEVIRNSGNYDNIEADRLRSSVNAATINFAAAPTTNQFRVVIIA